MDQKIYLRPVGHSVNKSVTNNWRRYLIFLVCHIKIVDSLFCDINGLFFVYINDLFSIFMALVIKLNGAFDPAFAASLSVPPPLSICLSVFQYLIRKRYY